MLQRTTDLPQRRLDLIETSVRLLGHRVAAGQMPRNVNGPTCAAHRDRLAEARAARTRNTLYAHVCLLVKWRVRSVYDDPGVVRRARVSPAAPA